MLDFYTNHTYTITKELPEYHELNGKIQFRYCQAG